MGLMLQGSGLRHLGVDIPRFLKPHHFHMTLLEFRA